MNIRSIVKAVTDPRWDFRVTVVRLSDGRFRTDLVSGGAPIVDATIRRLTEELDLYDFQSI